MEELCEGYGELETNPNNYLEFSQSCKVEMRINDVSLFLLVYHLNSHLKKVSKPVFFVAEREELRGSLCYKRVSGSSKNLHESVIFSHPKEGLFIVEQML